MLSAAGFFSLSKQSVFGALLKVKLKGIPDLQDIKLQLLWSAHQVYIQTVADDTNETSTDTA